MKAKALQLADEVLAKEYAPRLEIAKELRRLHLENEQLKSHEWVGLTDEEIETLIHRFDGDPHTLLDEVNARLKEKNNG